MNKGPYLNKGKQKMIIKIWKGQVIIEFGTSVDWIGLTPGEAYGLAKVLRDTALKIQGLKIIQKGEKPVNKDS